MGTIRLLGAGGRSKGKTPVLQPDEARLLESIDVSDLAVLRERELLTREPVDATRPARRSLATRRTSRDRSLVFAIAIVPCNYKRFAAANPRGVAREGPLIALSGPSAKSVTHLAARDSWNFQLETIGNYKTSPSSPTRSVSTSPSCGGPNTTTDQAADRDWSMYPSRLLFMWRFSGPYDARERRSRRRYEGWAHWREWRRRQ